MGIGPQCKGAKQHDMMFSEALKKPGQYWVFRTTWSSPLKVKVLKITDKGTLVQTTDTPFYLSDTGYDNKWIAFDNFWLAYAETLKRGGKIQ